MSKRILKNVVVAYMIVRRIQRFLHAALTAGSNLVKFKKKKKKNSNKGDVKPVLSVLLTPERCADCLLPVC